MAVVWGMTAATMLGVVFIPALCVVVERLIPRRTDTMTPAQPEVAGIEARPGAEQEACPGAQASVEGEEQA